MAEQTATPVVEERIADLEMTVSLQSKSIVLLIDEIDEIKARLEAHNQGAPHKI